VHADFLSGHLELAAAAGATIVYGEAADVHFPHRKVADGERIQLGLEFRATPGHTPESVCIVVWESPGADAPYGVLTGDTLFIGDVGRPDLQGGQGLSPEFMARQLYRSLHTSLLTLPDATRVYPAHGAGSEPPLLTLDQVLRLAAGGAAVLDVRSPGEFARGHLRGSVNVVRGPGEREMGCIEDSLHIPLGQLRDRVGELDPACLVVTYCAGGYRSSIAASLLRASGFADVSDLIGGYQAWQAAA
jgi:rhodanese-related sulfurtransferase